MCRITVMGASGSMGKALITIISQRNDVRLNAAITRSNNPLLGKDAGTVAGLEPVNIVLEDSLEKALGNTDIVIDFTEPETSIHQLLQCKKHNIPIVIGTTGFSDAQLNEIKQTSLSIPVLLSPNMSIGVNLLFNLVRNTAKIIGKKSDIEIIESHHELMILK